MPSSASWWRSLTWTGRADAASFSRLIDARVAELQAYVQFFWGEMRAIEIVVDEVAAELGGEDPLRPLISGDA